MCLLLVDQVDNQFKKPADACSIWRCVLLAAGRGVSSVCVCAQIAFELVAKLLSLEVTLVLDDI